MSKVSVIINCFNGAEYLKETLDSLKSQTYQDFEIIFWDNCSTDNTQEIAKKYGSQLKYFRGERTVPLGEARNLALSKVQGDYIAFLDADDLWEVDKLRLQVNELDNNPEVGMVCSNFQLLNMMTGEISISDKVAIQKELSFSEFVSKYNYSLSSFLIRKKCFDNLEYLFNPSLKYVEEFELFLRIAYAWKIKYLSEVLVTYRIHNSMNSMKLIDEKFDEYNIVLNTIKKLDNEIEDKYPEVIKWISFLRDYSGAKSVIRKGNNKLVRELMKPYLNYNFRAKCFYFLALMPSITTKKIVSILYKNKF